MEAKELENHKMLGYGLLDLQVGNWVTSDDVASFTFVREPARDSKFHVRELLAIMGKRFASAEADVIWQEIENYRQSLATTFGPPQAEKQLINFEEAAHSWYALYGLRFEKEWYLQADFDHHYAQRTGREHVTGRWIHWLHRDFGWYVEAGFSPWTILAALRSSQFEGLFKTLDLIRQPEQEQQEIFWVRLTAYLMNFSLSKGQVRQAVNEIRSHQVRLSFKQKREFSFAETSLDYFKRLELGGLGPEAINEMKY